MIKQTFLLNLRKSNNISQAFIAEKIGVSRASYIEIEKGAKELTVSQANKIADILNISLEELVSGKITS
ncbi:MAG: helix-turn-helix transcriptional regulator, partial [Candidatus Paceibacterota bacterium]